MIKKLRLNKFVLFLFLLCGMAGINALNAQTVPTGAIDGLFSDRATQYAYVDLGLPSGTLWASCNIGANNPEDYGDYFAWGETQPKVTYDWSTYQYCNGNYNTLTKYCDNSSYGNNGFTDNLTTLLPEDDAATVNWGNGWRMPTKAEFQELYNNTTVTWTTRNGLNGKLFSASNGNSIFLPAAGCGYNSDHMYMSTQGYYWSSSLGTGSPSSANGWQFSSGSNSLPSISRCYGVSVRPVKDGPQNTSFIINVTIDPVGSGTVTGGGSYMSGAECTVTATPKTGYTFVNWTIGSNVVSSDATYTFTVTGGRTLVANFTQNGSNQTYYVDLGLPSGLLWATCNIGADNPEDYGDYFAWGETQPKSIYDWSTYQYCMGSASTLTKYCSNAQFGYNGFTDNLTILLPEDDAAAADCSNGWRMPTSAELRELYLNTTVTWTTKNGVNGRLFTASNGNSIFLPAAGRRSDSGLDNEGSYGYYWSSSLSAEAPHQAIGTNFSSSSYSNGGTYGRLYGQSIRPVRDGMQNAYIINTTANPVEGGTVSGGGIYENGAQCTLTATPNTGYAFVNWTTQNGAVVSVVSSYPTYTFTVGSDRTLVANFMGAPEGAIDGLFSVSATQQIYFSQGNLQNRPSTNTWKFADNQYDYIGDNNSNISVSYYNGWIDLFGWGTSGYNHGAKCYQPWSTSTSNSDYYAYGNNNYNLNSQSGKADWGYNAIINGGNTENLWRTLTYSEWNYLFNTRSTTSGIRYAKANVNNVNGVILLPDDWSSSTYTLTNTNNSDASFSSNTLTVSQWNTLEQAGAVFLPAAGNRSEASVSNVGSYGYYWSASYRNSNYSNSVYFGDSNIGFDSAANRYTGRSVRLVRWGQSMAIITVTNNTSNGGEVSGGGSYPIGTNCTLTAAPNTGYTFVNWTENGEIVSTNATYTFTTNKSRTLVANFTQYGVDHSYIDLGLPSGLLWATYNIGTNTAEDYGDYFAWGETQPKETYDWSTYQYCMGSSSTLTKYCSSSSYGNNGFTDNLTTLLAEDDAATANWGNGWRMPTKDELQELYNNTTVTWTTRNGVNGRLFIASNGNSIFLPAAGFSHDGSLDDAGSYGNYWSSSLYTGSPSRAWFFDFFSSDYYVHGIDRSYGQSVRPVHLGHIVTVISSPLEGGEVSGGGSYWEGTECTLTATPSAGWSFVNWTEGGNVVSTDATYTFTVTENKNLVANFFQHTYVDLGLPSGLMWATCNVGADSPEDYGDYFAWGETQPNNYNWSTYQYCMGSSQTLTKYCNNSSYGNNGFTDNQTTLLPEDDAATANWGESWRMPTQAEWQELLDNTTVTWTAQGGVYGRLFTASNGNSLFLPAAGAYVNSTLSNVGSNGNYWSSSLYTNSPSNAWGLYFNSDSYRIGSTQRPYGQSVRPVRSIAFVTVTGSPADGGVVSGGGAYHENTDCTITATPSAGWSFINWTANGIVVSSDATYTFTVTKDISLVANFMANNAYVDLGLPSGLLWATYNVGADSPEEYGDSFAWGETQPKDYYDWSTYQYCMGTDKTLTKYCTYPQNGNNGFTDYLTILLPEDDAATANWGYGWRMPTKAEFEELYNNTTVTWTTQNGVNGQLFTASNGNSLFLPDARSHYNSSLSYPGSGHYWSSSLCAYGPDYARYLRFDSGSYEVDDVSMRSDGMSVRPVLSGQNIALDGIHFINAGNWNNASNWLPNTIPFSTDNVIINAAVTIPSTYIAYANNITIGIGGSITIEDGGQLICNNSVAATFQKNIAACPNNDSPQNWYLISSPVGQISTDIVTTGHSYNLFKFNEADVAWNGNGGANAFTTLDPGVGYLYRKSDNEPLVFSGDTYKGNPSLALTRKSDDELQGFNLIGNPYSHQISSAIISLSGGATFSGVYTLSTAGEWIAATETAIKPCEGFLVQIPTGITSTTATFTEPSRGTTYKHDYIRFNVTNNQNEDVAIALFDDSEGMDKLNHRNSAAPMLYITQNNHDYAIATMSDDTKLFNLSFKAATMGQYTLCYKANGEFNYLHIIDRLTGIDTDMLTDEKYTFIATPSDNANRFIVKLGYMPDYSDGDNDIFAYQNGNEILVSGEGELQIFDIAGRKVSTMNINGAETIRLSAQGVYIFRLIGTEVKTQKIVVR